MSDAMVDARSKMQQALEKDYLRRVIGKWMNFYAPRAKKNLADCLFGPDVVLAAVKSAEVRQSVPLVTILAAGSYTIIGHVSGDTTLYEALRNGDVSWKVGRTPRNYFNLCEHRDGVYKLLPYNVPISELPREVFLVVVDEKRDSKEVVLAAVRKNGRALMHASKKLRGDKEVVLAAVTQNSEALQLASKALRADRDFVITAVAQNGRALQFVPKALRADKEVVLAAVRQNGYALLYAPNSLLANEEVVLAAVRQNGMALVYVAVPLLAIKKVVLAAVAQNGMALQYAKAFKANREVVLAAVRQKGEALAYASLKLKADRGVVLAALKNNPRAIRFVSDTLKHDKEFLKAAYLS